VGVPPLRERKEDIPPLAHHFLRQHAGRYRKATKGFSEAAMRSLTEHPWPGNVRELDHAVERAVLMAAETEIGPADLGLRVGGSEAAARLDEMSLEEVECFLIRKALGRFDGNVSRAADALGLSRSALYRRLQRYGL
jgi:DNA-binding NtrC family response regulator